MMQPAELLQDLGMMRVTFEYAEVRLLGGFILKDVSAFKKSLGSCQKRTSFCCS